MRFHLSLLICLFLSFWLMFHTFTSTDDTLYISSKVYSDFGSIIPLIRHFPHGLNFPIQHPLFPGEPIRYHFLFYAPIGFFEHLGIPLKLALNIPSALGFFSMLFFIYYLARRSGWLALILVVFNSSFSFIDFFKLHSLVDLISLSNFVSFRPWNQSQIAAFWNLNIYTNQRHLGFSFAVCLLIYTILNRLRGKYLYLIGFLFGSLLLLNQAGFLISFIIIFFAFIFNSHLRSQILISLIGFLPWLFLYFQIILPPSFPQQFYGFLANQPVTLSNFLIFWWQNYGLSLILFVPAYLIFKPTALFPVMTLFVIGNVFRLSPDIINNHKLFNFIFILNTIYISRLLLRYKPLLLFLPFLVLGGIIDIFPIVNDRFISFPVSVDQKYFNSLPKDSVILNSTWFYHPASLAGLPVFNGYSYFTWSYGYNQQLRENKTISLYSSKSLKLLCRDLESTPISHIELSPHHETFIYPSSVFDSLSPEYQNPTSGLKVYSVKNLCTHI